MLGRLERRPASDGTVPGGRISEEKSSMGKRPVHCQHGIVYKIQYYGLRAVRRWRRFERLRVSEASRRRRFLSPVLADGAEKR